MPASMSKRLRSSIATVAVTVLVVTGITAATSIANETSGPWRSDDPNVVVVSVDGFDYDIPNDVAVVGYVVKRSQGLNGAVVELRLFLRDNETYLPIPPFETSATGNLSNARIGDAFVLVPAEGQEQP